MNKFHKTAYSRQQNFNNFVSSAHGKRQTWANPLSFNQKNEYQINRAKNEDCRKQINMHNVIEKKIQIESSLLFNNKNYGKNARPIQTANRKISNRSEAKMHQTSAGFSVGKERPQSKQEPRLKNSGTIEGKLKTETFLPERPQTSKGSRATTHAVERLQDPKQRKVSQNDQDVNIHIRITDKKSRNFSSSYSRRNNLSNQLSFETSIDPQFLALFAN